MTEEFYKRNDMEKTESVEDEMFENDEIDAELEDDVVLKNEELAEDEEENKSQTKKKEDSQWIISFLKFDKWKKQQEISILDFSTVQGTLSSITLIAVIVLLVKYIKLKKRN